VRLLAILAALAASAGPRAEASEPALARPNVIFVLADDLGSAELGSYGQQKIRTPSLDRLAAEGVRFTQHYSGNAVCAPSRAVLMTGQHPGHAPIRDNRELQPEGQLPLPAAAVTIAELFKKQGYATAAMGKWGLGPPGSEGDPLRQGFDHFFGYNCQRHAHNHYPTFLYDDDRRLPLDNPEIPVNQELPGGAPPADPRSYRGYAGKVYAPDLTAERARAFIRENRDRPFFLFLPTTVPHLALQVPEDSLAEYRGLWPDPPYSGDEGYLPSLSPRATYAAMVTRMDREVGRILDLVRELDLDERTIVVFASDNGPTYERIGGSDSEFFRSAGALRGLKGSLHEGGVCVPAIVRWKGKVPAGLVSERVTGFEDWLPTLLDLAGAKEAIPPAIDGLSFAPTLLGHGQEPRPFLYREFPGYGGQQSIRVGDWKGVRQGLEKPGPMPLALYDLKDDVGETRDVAAAHPDVVARMEALLAREHQPSAAFPIPALDGDTPGYVVGRSTAATGELLEATETAWGKAQRVTWGPDAIATSFRALSTRAGLAVRYDVSDPSPWHTLARRDAPLWNEEVVELFLDVGATGRSYAEVEWNPANTVVDLWVDRHENRFDRDWNVAGLESRVHTRRDAAGHVTGWTAVALLPWRALAAKAPAGTALPPKPGERWRFNVFRIERPGGPGEPAKDAQYLAWSPTGYPSFHVPLAFRELVFAGAANVCHEESREVMGCTGTVRACGPDASALPAVVGAALDELDRVDRLMSHYRPDSPLSRLNREAASGPVSVEPELLAFLAECLRWSRDSGGAFDVTVGPLMRAWGFFRDEGRVPEEAELAGVRSVVGYQHVLLDPDAGTIRFDRPGVELDLGGIGKGYAVDRVVSLLRQRGIASALVNLGGSSIYGLGAPPGKTTWEIGVRDPARPAKTALTVALRDRSLSVSGGYQRFFEKDGVAYSHIMDPHTGRPVHGLLSVAVLTERATDGDALDNVLFVQGLETSRATLGRLPPIEALFFVPNGRRTWTLARLGDRTAH
jgi:arylsulfatase A